MGLFKKDEPKVVLPEEVSKYYADQRRERRGTAIFMGLTALVLTLLIGLGLFFGGRWIYNRVAKKDSGTSQKTTGFENNSGLTISGNGGNSGNVAGSDDGQQSSGSSSDDAASSSASSNTSSTVNTDSSEAQTTTSGSGAMPYTGDEPAILPHTGDEGH